MALPNGCVEFAQSPQALVCADFIRVYFSTRQRDAFGKYVSHVAFVDFDRQLSRMLGVSKHAVIELGGLGCFDEHGIFPMSPVPGRRSRARLYDGVEPQGFGTQSIHRSAWPTSTDDGRSFSEVRDRPGGYLLAARAVSDRRRVRGVARRHLSHVVHLRDRVDVRRPPATPPSGCTRSGTQPRRTASLGRRKAGS